MDHDRIVKCLLAERSKVLGFIRAILGGWDGAEDVFQDASLLAIAKSTEITDEAHLMAWLRISCRNLARNLKRSNARSALSLSDEVLDLLEVHWAQQTERSGDRAQALSECLERLPPKSFAMIRLRYLEELSVQQIAEQLGRPAATLYVVFSRISATLADCIDRRLRSKSAAHER